MSKMPKFGQKRLILPLFPEKQGDFDPKMPVLDALLTKLNSYIGWGIERGDMNRFSAPCSIVSGVPKYTSAGVA